MAIYATKISPYSMLGEITCYFSFHVAFHMLSSHYENYAQLQNSMQQHMQGGSGTNDRSADARQLSNALVLKMIKKRLHFRLRWGGSYLGPYVETKNNQEAPYLSENWNFRLRLQRLPLLPKPCTYAGHRITMIIFFNGCMMHGGACRSCEPAAQLGRRLWW
jgi:hypothetical protein